jgi:hypothetical protein
VDISILNPIDAGPRYFFFPFILLSWVLIQYCFSHSKWIKYICGIFILTSCINATPYLVRHHTKLQWKEDVIACAKSENYTFPVHYAGQSGQLWSFTLRGEQCINLLNNDLFYRADTEK